MKILKYIIRENSINNKKKDYSKNISDTFSIYADWKRTIDDIKDKELQKKLYCVLSKYVISTCRRFKADKGLPEGVNKKFLISNSLNFKEFIKTIFFITFRKLYIKL